jgi:probable phosphoglycerate mutase
VYLQRHAQSANNARKVFTCKKLDPDLTDKGRSQAAELVEFYRRAGVARVVSSTARRARQTGEIIAAGLGVELDCDADLLEVDVGELEGKSEADAQNMRQFRAHMTGWLFEGRTDAWPGGESLDQVRRRLDRLGEKYFRDPGPTLLVAHCALIAVTLGLDGGGASLDDVILPNAGVAGFFEPPGQWRRVR